MASPGISSSVQELVEQFETASVNSDTPISEPSSPDQGSVNTANTANTEDEADEVDEADRPFIAPSKCYGFKWVKSKGLTLCPKNAKSSNKFAFCGKTHQDAFQQSAVHPSFQELFYHLIAVVSDTRTDLEDRFAKHVVPYFILSVAQTRKYRERRPVFLTFNSLDDAYEFQNDIKPFTAQNFRQFYLDVKADLRRYMRNIVATLRRTPDQHILEWDMLFQNLQEPDFSRITFRYYIDLA